MVVSGGPCQNHWSPTGDYFYNDWLMSMQDYWQLARGNARQALQTSGVIPGNVQPQLGFMHLFP